MQYQGVLKHAKLVQILGGVTFGARKIFTARSQPPVFKKNTLYPLPPPSISPSSFVMITYYVNDDIIHCGLTFWADLFANVGTHLKEPLGSSFLLLLLWCYCCGLPI